MPAEGTMPVVGEVHAPRASRTVRRAGGRLRLVEVPFASADRAFASAVQRGLSGERKSLPCRFFYDAEGSRLFEAICHLQEYYPTRTEEGILARAASEIAGSVGAGSALVELGSGSSRKTRLLIEALLARQGELHYAPIDISARFLEQSAHGLLVRYPRLYVTALGGEYDDALPHLPRHDGPRLLAFLGGNIGNLDEPEAVAFLARVAGALAPRDRLLVGFDRLKAPAVIESAYNDPGGVTEAFNKNLLARINRELGGRFDLDAFAHAAPFVTERSRIEMHLVSRCSQTVPVASLGRSFRFEAGETIHTESSHKYDLPRFTGICEAAGLSLLSVWSDPLDWFSLALLAPSGR